MNCYRCKTEPCTCRDGLSVYHGKCEAVLPTLPAASVQMCVTSPPYWGLRDYGVDGQLGLEPTPEEYVTKMVAVFREVWRVLRDDGVLWMNMGDGYAGGHTTYQGKDAKWQHGENNRISVGHILGGPGLKPKDLIGMPWMLAFALRAAGWYLRSDVIWSKPNPMPESVTDRPTKAHEYMFLLTKGQWKTRVIQFSDLASERVHFGNDFRFQSTDSGAGGFCVSLATAILDFTQTQHDVCLPPFYSEVWQQRTDGSNSDFVGNLPVEHRAAIWAARFLASDCSAKDLLEQLNSLFVTLPNGNQLLKRWSVSKLLSAPLDVDGNTTITVHDAGKICKIEFSHNRIIVSTPMTCKYFYDADAIREPAGDNTHSKGTKLDPPIDNAGIGHKGWHKYTSQIVTARNKRTVWTVDDEPAFIEWLAENYPEVIDDFKEQCQGKKDVWTVPSRSFPGAHFATFPPDLIVPCILAGTSDKGCCPECGAPWERVTDKTRVRTRPGHNSKSYDRTTGEVTDDGIEKPWRDRAEIGNRDPGRHVTETHTVGWQPGCYHGYDPVPCVVLDPFHGAGTTGMVCRQLGRHYIGIELNQEYLDMSLPRLRAGYETTKPQSTSAGQGQLF